MTAQWVTGNALDVLRDLPDNSIDLVVTSPPFLNQRSYLPDDDPAKVDEIGDEHTPGEFIDNLLHVTEALRRVLAPHGSICVELGDTYSGSGGAGGDYNDDGLRSGQPRFKSQRKAAFGTEWPAPKSLCLIPELYRIALVYGFNPLTGRTTPRWRARNVVRWVRPNPNVGALGDKFRPGTSEMVILCGTDEAGRTRYFDLYAVRQTASPNTNSRVPKGVTRKSNTVAKAGIADHRDTLDRHKEDGTAPPLDWWHIPTHGYADAHYATFPPALVVKPVEAMCPLRVCLTCGQPSRRIVESDSLGVGTVKSRQPGHERHVNSTHAPDYQSFRTVGWTDCGHGDHWRTGRVLDPFAGSGTTGQVATGHGRDFIGIDLDHRNVDLARERIGMFFEHVTAPELGATLASPVAEGAA